MSCAILFTRESQNIKGGLTVTPGLKKRGMAIYVTHDELIQIGIFIVSLIGLCYTFFESKHKK